METPSLIPVTHMVLTHTHIQAFVCARVFSGTHPALKLKDYMKQSGLGHQQVRPTE